MNVCGPTSASAFTVSLLSGGQTVATRTAQSGCVNFAFTAIQGRTYRIDVRAGSLGGTYTGCYDIGGEGWGMAVEYSVQGERAGENRSSWRVGVTYR